MKLGEIGNALSTLAIAARPTDESVTKNSSTTRQCALSYTARPTGASNSTKWQTASTSRDVKMLVALYFFWCHLIQVPPKERPLSLGTPFN